MNFMYAVHRLKMLEDQIIVNDIAGRNNLVIEYSVPRTTRCMSYTIEH